MTRIRTFAILAGLAAVTVGLAAPAKWLTNWDEAVKQSKKTGRPILADFTGSDWCGWCIRLNREVFSKPEFTKWATGKVILLKLDFPRQRRLPVAEQRQNARLARQYRVEGFPTILFLNHKGTVLGQSGYMEGGPKVWIAEADRMLKGKRG